MIAPLKKVENQKLKQIFTKDENSFSKMDENNSKFLGDKMQLEDESNFSFENMDIRKENSFQNQMQK